MKLAVSSASTPSLAPAQLVEHAQRCGYQGVEWRVAPLAGITPARPWDFKHNNRCTVAPTRQALTEIAERCATAGLTLVALSPYLPVGERAPAEELIGWASEIGATCIRVWGPSTEGPGPYLPALERFHRWVDDLAPVLQHHGVRLGLENHQRTVTASVSMAMRVLEQHAPAVLGLVYDIGNLAVEGYENPAWGIEMARHRITHVQVKNATWAPTLGGGGWTWSWCPMASGVLDLPLHIRTLAQNGYTGWVSAEDFDSSQTDGAKLAHNHTLLQTWITQALSVAPTTTP
jgi:sugar phosphate isomerase/epimerase